MQKYTGLTAGEFAQKLKDLVGWDDSIPVGGPRPELFRVTKCLLGYFAGDPLWPDDIAREASSVATVFSKGYESLQRWYSTLGGRIAIHTTLTAYAGTPSPFASILTDAPLTFIMWRREETINGKIKSWASLPEEDLRRIGDILDSPKARSAFKKMVQRAISDLCSGYTKTIQIIVVRGDFVPDVRIAPGSYGPLPIGLADDQDARDIVNEIQSIVSRSQYVTYKMGKYGSPLTKFFEAITTNVGGDELVRTIGFGAEFVIPMGRGVRIQVLTGKGGFGGRVKTLLGEVHVHPYYSQIPIKRLPSGIEIVNNAAQGAVIHYRQFWDGGNVKEQEQCAQVVTYARNPATWECRSFPTPCHVPSGWTVVNSCPEPSSGGGTQPSSGDGTQPSSGGGTQPSSGAPGSGYIASDWAWCVTRFPNDPARQQQCLLDLQKKAEVTTPALIGAGTGLGTFIIIGTLVGGGYLIYKAIKKR